MSTCPTVRIKSDAKGFVIINEADFDPKTQTLFVAVKSASKRRQTKLHVKAE